MPVYLQCVHHVARVALAVMALNAFNMGLVLLQEWVWRTQDGVYTAANSYVWCLLAGLQLLASLLFIWMVSTAQSLCSYNQPQ